MELFNEKDLALLQHEAKKLGLEIIRETEIPLGEEDNYIALGDINIFDAICIPYDYSALCKYNKYDGFKNGQAA